MARHETDHPHELLADFAADVLGEREAQDVRLHILQCQDCLNIVEEYRMILKLAPEALSTPVPRELSDRILMDTIGRPSRATREERAQGKGSDETLRNDFRSGGPSGSRDE